MNKHFAQRSDRQFDLEETFEIMIENIRRCVWDTVPDSQFLYSLPVVKD